MLEECHHTCAIVETLDYVDGVHNADNYSRLGASENEVVDRGNPKHSAEEIHDQVVELYCEIRLGVSHTDFSEDLSDVHLYVCEFTGEQMVSQVSQIFLSVEGV